MLKLQFTTAMIISSFKNLYFRSSHHLHSTSNLSSLVCLTHFCPNFFFFYSTEISIFIPCFLFLSKPQGKKLDRSYEMKKVVRQVIKGLERAGLVYFKDSRTDLYEVINLTINKPVSPTVHSGSSKKWIFSFFFSELMYKFSLVLSLLLFYTSQN